MYLDKDGNIIPNKSSSGIFSVGVPGVVAGMVEVHEHWGKLPFEKLLQPAIDLAESGVPVSKHMYDKLVSEKENLMKSPTIKKLFYHKDGTPLQIGEKFIQKDLAKTLREIQKKGRDGFYDGWVADAWIKTSQKHGGLLTKGDFDAYQVKYRAPVKGTYNNMEVVSMPPPSSGGIALIQILGMLDQYNLKKLGRLSPQTVHLVSTSMQLAFRDRFLFLGDSDFADVPTRALVSKKRIQTIAKKIPSNKAIKSENARELMKSPYESTETAHFSMMDNEGNAVSTTQSVNYYFGSGVVAEGSGVVMNNTMDDFSVKVPEPNKFGSIGGVFNRVEPQKKPLSSMAPTIVLKQGQPVMSLGTPDGPRIITCMAQALINYFEFGMPLGESINAGRYHHQWDPDEIRVDSPGFSPELTKSLEKMGHKVSPKDFFCKVQAVAKEAELHAFSDYRGIESVAGAK